MAASTGPRVEARSDLFELVGIPSGLGDGKLAIHLSDFWTNAPVNGAAIEVTIGETTSKAAETRGLYEIEAPWVKRPGKYDLVFSIAAGPSSDLLIGTLEIPPAPSAPARHDSIWDHVHPELHKLPTPPAWLAPSAFAFALVLLVGARRMNGGMRRLGMMTASLAGMSSITLAAVLVLDHEHSDAASDGIALLDVPEAARRLEDGSTFVPKPTQRLLGISTTRTDHTSAVQKTVRLIGQVIPDPNRSGLVQALLAGRIEPPDGGFPAIGSKVKAGDVLGYLVPRVEVVDQSDIRQTTGDLDRQITLAEAKLSRLERLKNIVADSQISDARLELDGLRARRAAIKPVLAEREALLAPVDGVIAETNVVAGQVVEARSLLFQIVDPGSLWVEALSYDATTAAEVGQSGGDAIASTADGRTVSLAFSGRALTLRQQAIPLRFRVKGSDVVLSIGEPVSVLAPVEEPISAVALPRSAIVRSSNGQAIVWAHTGAERFEPRVVVSVPVDAERVGIKTGLEPGTRVVVRGAELVNQVR